MAKSGKSNSYGPEYSRERKFKVILEEIQKQFRVFGEGLQGIHDRLDRVEARLGAVEERLDRIEMRLDRVETRLDRLEHKVDTFIVQVSGHEKRLKTLEHTR